MQTALTLLGVICRFSFFAGAPVLLLIALKWAQWRPFFRGLLLTSVQEPLRWSLPQIWTRCHVLFLLGAVLMGLHNIRQMRMLNWYFHPVEVTWWITSIGQVVFGVGLWFFLMARRQVPCVRVNDLIVEFFRMDAKNVQVHVQRKSFFLLHGLAPAIEHSVPNFLEERERKNPLLRAVDAALSQPTLAALENMGVERIEVFSPLIEPPLKNRLIKEMGNSILGYSVTHTSTRLPRVESFSLLFMRMFTTWKWLRDHLVWVKDKALLNSRIPLNNWYRPVIHGFVIDLKPLEK
ncbi:hypothetical protein os4_37160 (plasmid) [Comamonadaceae bacterium OS-4]|nr:hypothetical protein os4_37160 [Comamonadaceae bacterium OS-4]